MAVRRQRTPPGDARHKQLEIVDRRARVAQLYLRHWTQRQIADELGVDQSTVCRDLAELEAEWQASALATIAERKRREGVELDAMERDVAGLYDDYDVAVRTGQADVITAILRDVDERQVSISIRFSDDPRFGALDRRLKIKARRAAMLGLDSPRVSQVTGLEGAAISVDVTQLDALDEAELRELLAAARRINAEAE